MSTQLSGDPIRALTDLERRTIGNLAIPRNVANLAHELRIDPHTRMPNGDNFNGHEADVNTLLAHAQEQGWVVKISENRDPAKVAAHTPKDAYPWHDESREIYAARLVVPERQWRMEGDLWLLSQKGLEKLQEPVGTSSPMTPSQVQVAVDTEWARVIKDTEKIADHQVGALLEQHFMEHWFTPVADECERVWGVRPVAPLAGGAGWTDVFENRILDQENQKTLMPALVDPWFMAMTILAFTDTDTGTTADDGTHKPTYTGYARASTPASSLAVASAGSSSNTVAVVYAACTAGTSTILGFGNCSTVTVGELRKYGTCASTTVSTTQTPAQFAIGAYTTTAD